MYKDETHPPMLNELTKRLYAEGYTRENYPNHVWLSDWQNFGYKWEYALKTTWETHCGLMIEGESGTGRGLNCGDTYYDGIWYCPENNNPVVTCPIRDCQCQYRIPWNTKIIQCPCHLTEHPYDYEKSVEKINAQHTEAAHKQYMEITGGSVCSCVVGNNGETGGYYQVKYDVDMCIRSRCTHETCIIRKQPRDLTKTNVFYDIRRTWITRKGLLDDKRVEITKGVKVFDHAVAKTDAEIWLKQKEAGYALFYPKHTKEDRAMQYFTKQHRTWPEYDYFEFHYEVENIRVDTVRIKRDLLQDLRDASEGIEIVHASIVQKEKAQAKRDAKEARGEQKKKQSHKRAIAKLTAILSDETQREHMKEYARRELTKRGVMPEAEKEEQLALF